MKDEETYEVSAQDVIDSLIEQRNSALNELARAQAALMSLKRKGSNGALKDSHGEPRGLPAVD